MAKTWLPQMGPQPQLDRSTRRAQRRTKRRTTTTTTTNPITGMTPAQQKAVSGLNRSMW